MKRFWGRGWGEGGGGGGGGKGEGSLPSFPAYITSIYCAVERCELAFFPFKMLFLLFLYFILFFA
jgi:hypothetical protein